MRLLPLPVRPAPCPWPPRPMQSALTSGEMEPHLARITPPRRLPSRIVRRRLSPCGRLPGSGGVLSLGPRRRAAPSAATVMAAPCGYAAPEREQAFYISDHGGGERLPPVPTLRGPPVRLAAGVADLAPLRLGGAIDYDHGQAFQRAERESPSQGQSA